MRYHWNLNLKRGRTQLLKEIQHKLPPRFVKTKIGGEVWKYIKKVWTSIYYGTPGVSKNFAELLKYSFHAA